MGGVRGRLALLEVTSYAGMSLQPLHPGHVAQKKKSLSFFGFLGREPAFSPRPSGRGLLRVQGLMVSTTCWAFTAQADWS